MKIFRSQQRRMRIYSLGVCSEQILIIAARWTAVATSTSCGVISYWSDGLFGDNFGPFVGLLWFTADETPHAEAAVIAIDHISRVSQFEGRLDIAGSDLWSFNGPFEHVSWLLVKDSEASASVPEPSILALLGLGILGLGLSRRRLTK